MTSKPVGVHGALSESGDVMKNPCARVLPRFELWEKNSISDILYKLICSSTTQLGEDSIRFWMYRRMIFDVFYHDNHYYFGWRIYKTEFKNMWKISDTFSNSDIAKAIHWAQFQT
jgi:hypothetical protein